MGRAANFSPGKSQGTVTMKPVAKPWRLGGVKREEPPQSPPRPNHKAPGLGWGARFRVLTMVAVEKARKRLAYVKPLLLVGPYQRPFRSTEQPKNKSPTYGSA